MRSGKVEVWETNCPLPLHHPLRQKDGTYKCRGCGKTWNEYPTMKVGFPVSTGEKTVPLPRVKGRKG